MASSNTDPRQFFREQYGVDGGSEGVSQFEFIHTLAVRSHYFLFSVAGVLWHFSGFV